MRPCEDLCGIALEIAQPRIALSLKIQPVRFQTLNPFKTSNSQLSEEARVASFEAALEQEAPKPNRKE